MIYRLAFSRPFLFLLIEQPLHEIGLAECRIPAAVIASRKFEIFHLRTGSLQGLVCFTGMSYRNHIICITMIYSEFYVSCGREYGSVGYSASPCSDPDECHPEQDKPQVQRFCLQVALLEYDGSACKGYYHGAPSHQ